MREPVRSFRTIANNLGVACAKKDKRIAALEADNASLKEEWESANSCSNKSAELLEEEAQRRIKAERERDEARESHRVSIGVIIHSLETGSDFRVDREEALLVANGELKAIGGEGK